MLKKMRFIQWNPFFSVCFDNYYTISFIMSRLEMYKSNLYLKKEGGDVFFFSPDVHTFLCVIIHYITKTNKNQLPIINIY